MRLDHLVVDDVDGKALLPHCLFAEHDSGCELVFSRKEERQSSWQNCASAMRDAIFRQRDPGATE